MPNTRAAQLVVIVVLASLLAGERRMAAQFFVPVEGECPARLLGPVQLDVPSIVVQPQILLNGAPFPGNEGGAAILTLWASEPSPLFDGPQLVLAETHLARNPVRVIPGVYDVYYSWLSGADIPRNQATRVLQGVTLDHGGDLVIDLRMIRVEGFKHHNGIPFGYDGFAALSLRSLDRPGSVALGSAQPAEFETAIMPGRYAFEYDWQQGASVPHNRHSAVRELDLLSSARDLVLNVPSVMQPFQFLLNGVGFPSSEFNRGDLVLRRGANDEVLVGSSHEGDSAVPVIPGSYDVHWRHVVGANVPANSDVPVARGLRITGAPRVIDVPSIEVSGTFLLNGQPTPITEFENARIHLVGRNSGDTLRLGETRYGGFLAHVVPGAYDIVYEHVVGAALPVNPRATLARGWRIEHMPQRTIDIPAGTYKGDYVWNGGNFPPSEFNNGQVYAVPTAADADPVLLGQTRYGAFDLPLLPGGYRAAYGHEVGANVPQNAFTTFGPTRRVIGEAETIESIEVQSGPLEVTFLHNGTLLPAGGPQNIRVHLSRGLNYLRLPESIDGPRAIEAIGGRFDLFYQYRGGPNLPRNAFMRFGCWTLTP
jgi:hypothetical protein